MAFTKEERDAFDKEDVEEVKAELQKEENQYKRSESGEHITHRQMQIARLVAGGMVGGKATSLYYTNQKDPYDYYYRIIHPKKIFREQVKRFKDAFAVKLTFGAKKRVEELEKVYKRALEIDKLHEAILALKQIGNLIGDRLPDNIESHDEDGNKLSLVEQLEVYREALNCGIINEEMFKLLREGHLDASSTELVEYFTKEIEKSKQLKKGNQDG